MVTPRYFSAASLLFDGRVLITGGFAVNIQNTIVGVSEIYDPSTGSFSSAGALAAPRYWHSSTPFPNGAVLLVGGAIYVGGVATPVSGSEVFNSTTKQFTAGPSLGTPRWNHTATLLNDGRLLVAGGFGPSILGSAEITN
jgi:hypothetical protein